MTAAVRVARTGAGTIIPHARRRRNARRDRGGAARPFSRPRFLLIVTAATVLFLYAPIIVVIVFSFNSVKSLTTFHNLSLYWYRYLAHDGNALASIRVSVAIALATMAASTAIGSALAFGLARARRRIARLTEGAMLLNLLAPEVATAVALLLLFSGIGMQLSSSTIVLGHITFSIAYVAIIVGARLAGISREYEEAARDLGATEVQSIRLITVPLLWPAILGAGVLVFLLSFDDFVTSYFTSGIGTPPLPLFIYGLIRFGVTPEINAIGTLMMTLTILLGITGVTLVSFRGTFRGARRAHQPAEGGE